MSESTNKGRPFIIWTLQRTGGTNLTQRLIERSGFKGIQHEPFNKGRILGHITDEWIATKNKQKLDEEIQDIIKQEVIIKHCLEMVPIEITFALAEAATKAGYNHLFLYRKNALDRLLSLHFAVQTGIWGPDAKKKQNQEQADIAPISAEKLAQHELRCVTLLEKTWEYLISLNANPIALSYEQVYLTEQSKAADNIYPVIKKLGLSRTDNDNVSFINSIISAGFQGTRDKYESIPGLDNLKESLSHINHFNPIKKSTTLQIKSFDLPSWIVFAKIDTTSELLPFGKQSLFTAGGVIVVNAQAPKNLELIINDEKSDNKVKWDIRSNFMAKKFPESPQSSHARFKTEEITLDSQHRAIFYLQDESKKKYSIFNVIIK